MGVNPFWQEDFLLTLQNFFHPAKIHTAEPFFVINCNEKLAIHLVPINNSFDPLELLNLQAEYQQKDQLLVHLWEDIWTSKREQVLSRISSFLGMNKSIHGRKAQIENLSQAQINPFLEKYHLQGAVKAKYNYGLRINQDLIAVASFSLPRPMKDKGNDYSSAELVRFASKEGFTIVGGLSKLIKYFTQQIKVNDLMTYADRDWSLGNGYEKLGFELSATTPPTALYVQNKNLTRYFPHRIPQETVLEFEQQNILNLHEFLLTKGFFKLFNTGNLKYHLYL